MTPFLETGGVVRALDILRVICDTAKSRIFVQTILPFACNGN